MINQTEMKPNLNIWLSPFGLFDSLFKFEQIQLYSDWGEFTLRSRLVIENYFIPNLNPQLLDASAYVGKVSCRQSKIQDFN